MKKAFTLSEVLITLGVIGVVSALTIPSLIQNYQKHLFVSQLKKSYAEMTEAFATYLTDTQTPTIRINRFDAQNFFQTYLKTSKICDSSNWDECINSSVYTRINGTGINLLSVGTVCAVLKSGSVACIYPNDLQARAQYPLALNIDTNGKQDPNIGGRDYFRFNVTPSGEIVSYTTQDVHHTDAPNEMNAFSRILRDGWEMNY